MQIGSTSADTVTYKINGLGQRYQKVGAGQFVYSTITTVNASTGLSPQSTSLAYNARYVYDEQGRLLGEYSPEGKLIQETIWLDDLPVATLRPKGASVQLPLGIAGTGASTANNTGSNTPTNPANVDVFYVHPDHLGTPRVATRSTEVGGATAGPNAINKAVWRWESDPFGTSLDNSKPVENPQLVTGTASQIAAASFRVSNRFPGQQFDLESGKQYNYFRDYDPAIGRYVESDPIGLRGGLSTDGYVFGKPQMLVDPKGDIPGKPNPEEIRRCQSRPFECGRAAICAAQAQSAASTYMGKGGGPGDAIRHCVWSCCMAKAIGIDGASDWGDAHESNSTNRADTCMDQHNNFVGRCLSFSKDSCEDSCFNGLFGPSGGCPGLWPQRPPPPPPAICGRHGPCPSRQ